MLFIIPPPPHHSAVSEILTDVLLLVIIHIKKIRTNYKVVLSGKRSMLGAERCQVQEQAGSPGHEVRFFGTTKESAFVNCMTVRLKIIPRLSQNVFFQCWC